MPSSQQLLDQAPQEEVAALHAARMGREGLLQRSRIRDEVAAWLLDASRLPDILGKTDGAKSAARSIHLAGPHGIPSDRFLASAEADLEMLASEFVVILDDNEPASWCPLSDLTPAIFEDWAAPLESRPRPQGRKSAARTFLEGIASLTAAIDTGKARLNRDGSLNRRDRPALRDRFVHLAPFGESAQERALDLALDLLSESNLIRQKDGHLETASALDAWLAEADRDPMTAILWWERRHPVAEGLRDLLKPRDELGLPAHAAIELFRRREGDLSEIESPAIWNNLPDSLKQAIAIGLLEADGNGAILEHIWTGIVTPAPRAERAWWCTSDFQLFLAPDAPLLLHRAAEFMGQRESSDLVSRYRIVRDALLAGASAPCWGPRLPDLIESLAPPRAVAFQLEEWLASRRACLFDSIRILRVSDPRRHQELAALDSFRSLVREVIPGWGFVLDPVNEAPLRKLLGSLGYDPPSDPSPAEQAPWVSLEPCLPPPVESEPPSWQWPRLGGATRRTSTGSGSRYATGAPKELEIPDLVRLVEYAALTECEVEVILKAQPQRSLRLRPRRVDRRKEPVSMEAYLSSSGERRDIALDSIRKIALVES